MHNRINYFPTRARLFGVTKDSLRADLLAAITAVILVLPQSIAFAAIAGMPVEYGFYTAIVTPMIAAIFGSSRYMVSGPTTALSALLFSSLSGSFEPGTTDYVQAAICVTFMAGILQASLGMLRLGSLANFVSPPSWSVLPPAPPWLFF